MNSYHYSVGRVWILPFSLVGINCFILMIPHDSPCVRYMTNRYGIIFYLNNNKIYFCFMKKKVKDAV